jgi:hypothetical protein
MMASWRSEMTTKFRYYVTTSPSSDKRHKTFLFVVDARHDKLECSSLESSLRLALLLKESPCIQLLLHCVCEFLAVSANMRLG